MKKLMVVGCRLLVVGCWVLAIGCSTTEKPTEQQIAEHQKDVDTWFNKRIDDLKGHDGWLNLAGLFWLKDGMNSFGSDESNDIVFPAGKIAGKAGYFFVKDRQVTMMPAPELGLQEQVIFHPDSVKPVTVTSNSLEWFIIRRDNIVGIRLRDLDSDAVKHFTTVDRYPVDIEWKLPAKFEPAAAGEKINITNVLGQTTAEDLAGTYVFELAGKEHRLFATGKGARLFVVFSDLTNGSETYGAGRFIYIDRPDSTGRVSIDFNKSYNPPCAFTEFATCPLPPKENSLTVGILAGEKNYDLHHGKQTTSGL